MIFSGREVFLAHEVTQEDPEAWLVAKRYCDAHQQKNKDAYFKEAQTHMLARYWAQQFNATLAQKNPNDSRTFIEFLPVWVIVIETDHGEEYYNLEPFIKSEANQFIKYTNSDCTVYQKCEDNHFPTAFMHFTYEYSNRQCVVSDIQGWGILYTDPQINSSQRRFNEGYDRGQRGLSEFLIKHKCNDVCKMLFPPNEQRSN